MKTISKYYFGCCYISTTVNTYDLAFPPSFHFDYKANKW